jgi:hypothetical protein
MTLYFINWVLWDEDICRIVGRAPAFLNAVLDGSEWSASYSGRLTPGDTTPNTQYI